MIAALLTIIGLIIGLSEKVTLFQTPITLKKVLIVSLFVAAAVVSFIKDLNDSNQRDHDSKTIDTLKSNSNILNDQISYLRKESKAAEREYTDSIVSYHNYTTDLLAKYGYKIDTLTNSVRKIDTSKGEAQPTLAILPTPIFQKNNNETNINYEISALTANAHILGYYYVLINTKAGMPYEKPLLSGGILNFTTVIPAGDTRVMTLFLDRIKKFNNITDTFVLAMHFDYKSKSNKVQTPLRKVYVCYYSRNNIQETGSDEFILIANYLKKYKIWNKFYNL